MCPSPPALLDLTAWAVASDAGRKSNARTAQPCWQPSPASRRRADRNRGRDLLARPSPQRGQNQAETSEVS
jgi:hypothetical protein